MRIVFISRHPGNRVLRRGLRTAGAILCLALAAAGCTRPAEEIGGRISVVASFYPLAEAASLVGGDLVAVRNLTPPGVEPHDLELAPDAIAAIQEADVVLYLGGGFAPAVERAVTDARGEAVDLLAGNERDHDPHVWLDPVRYQRIIGQVEAALARVLPRDARRFASNAGAFDARLQQLDRSYRTGLGHCPRHLIVTTHEAFGYLAARYGLVQQPISGLSPDAEPSPQRLAELAALVRREGVTTIFSEDLVSPRVAETLSREAGVGTAVLSSLEGLTERQVAAGDDYVSLMRRNLRTLQTALGCTAIR